MPHVKKTKRSKKLPNLLYGMFIFAGAEQANYQAIIRLNPDR